VLAKNSLHEEIVTTPPIAGDRTSLRTDKALSAFGKRDERRLATGRSASWVIRDRSFAGERVHPPVKTAVLSAASNVVCESDLRCIAGVKPPAVARCGIGIAQVGEKTLRYLRRAFDVRG
jgi:hypothetical protein